MNKAVFDNIVNTVMKNRQKEMLQAQDIISNFCALKDFKDPKSEFDKENVNLESFNMLSDYLTYHPHKVKRNKNHSVDIMNALRA